MYFLMFLFNFSTNCVWGNVAAYFCFAILKQKDLAKRMHETLRNLSKIKKKAKLNWMKKEGIFIKELVHVQRKTLLWRKRTKWYRLCFIVSQRIENWGECLNEKKDASNKWQHSLACSRLLSLSLSVCIYVRTTRDASTKWQKTWIEKLVRAYRSSGEHCLSSLQVPFSVKSISGKYLFAARQRWIQQKTTEMARKQQKRVIATTQPIN